DLESVVLDQSKTLCEEFGRVLCINVDSVYVQIFGSEKETAKEKAERLRKKADKIYWYKSKIKRYNKMEYSLPKPTIVERVIEPSNEKFKFELPKYEIIKDPGFDDHKGAKKWAKD